MTRPSNRDVWCDATDAIQYFFYIVLLRVFFLEFLCPILRQNFRPESHWTQVTILINSIRNHFSRVDQVVIWHSCEIRHFPRYERALR